MNMDIKRASHKTGLGDGPEAKRAMEEQQQEDQEQDKETNYMQLDADCDSLHADRGSVTLSPNNHVAPFTGNGCEPSLESYMFHHTPAGSQLCSWMSNADSRTLGNDAVPSSEVDKDTKTVEKSSKLNRKEQSEMRRQNALRALALERELSTKAPQTPTLIIRFPDPKINVAIVSEFSQSIRDVVFPTNVAERYCLVHLKPGANIEQTIKEINRIRFGNGHLHAEVKTFTDAEQADCIDPCSLYVSNIPFNMNAADIKAFVNSTRVDIGVMKRQKRARFAFVRYSSAETAMEAFKDLVRRTVNNRVLTVRYRRQRKRLPQVAPSSLCGASNLTINTIPSDDETAECRVISPPPVESITIIDSDDNGSDSSQSRSLQAKKKRETKLSASDKEIEKLKMKMAQHEAIIKSLQMRQNSVVNTAIKVEPQSERTTDMSSLMQHSLSPCSSYDIKMENEYLGIAQSTPDPEHESMPEADNQLSPPYRPTTCAIDGSEDPIKSSNCFGWLITGLGRRKSTKSVTHSININSGNQGPKDANLEGLYAQLEKDLDT
ncbi:protein painting of fourth isoform X1 [Drosophila sulfurigaster albostrigata]|uniref:protein painting of fourth isoform X1 n=1 Tax=Drosophila sulfurigaster albostrigata TaxID=89887 RepID=UPI002D21CEA9|nr:protein painting of fourth isoform X1 [Drosophila sulfurigaster albostrigata]